MRMEAVNASCILDVFRDKILPTGTDDVYYSSYEELARNVIARERLLWAMAQKLSIPTKTIPPAFAGRNLSLTEDALGDFDSSFYENYIWGECCVFEDMLFHGFAPLGEVKKECIYLPDLIDDFGSPEESYDDILDKVSPEELMEQVLGEPGVVSAIPDYEELLRGSLAFDPGREYSDPVALLLKSERIGRFLSLGIEDEEVSELMEIISEPLISNYVCLAGVSDGIWYCGTFMAALDEYSTVALDALNPRFAAACVKLHDLLSKYERGGKRRGTSRRYDSKRGARRCKRALKAVSYRKRMRPMRRAA